jgi:hypothetical protein
MIDPNSRSWSSEGEWGRIALALVESIIPPGPKSPAFNKRGSSGTQIAHGLAGTVALSGLLGYLSPGEPLDQLGSVGSRSSVE